MLKSKTNKIMKFYKFSTNFKKIYPNRMFGYEMADTFAKA